MTLLAGNEEMKNWSVSIRYSGLSGEYLTKLFVKAKDQVSAKKKAEKTIGNRDGYVVSVISE